MEPWNRASFRTAPTRLAPLRMAPVRLARFRLSSSWRPHSSGVNAADAGEADIRDGRIAIHGHEEISFH
jgi:hypothetical protein